MLDPNSIEILSFDCYGTLIDWENGILGALRPVLSRHSAKVDDEELLALYAQIESSAQQLAYRPYRDILRSVMREISIALQFSPNADELNVLSESIANWLPFPDTVDSLRRLKTKYKLAIFSNIDDDLFATSNKRLAVDFDYVITAQQARAYKPSPHMFEYAFDKLRVDPSRILHVAQSLYHDITPAQSLGLKTVWVNRRKGRPGTGATPNAEASASVEVATLRELVELLES